MLSKLTACRWWLTGLLLLFTSITFAQQRNVTGTVVSGERKDPVAGATVAVKGSKVATITDEKGAFSITVPSANSVLVISFVGFESAEIAVGSQTNLSVSLTTSSSNLTDVVVTGYSSQVRRSIVGAVSTIKGEKLAAIPSGNVEQQFQGRVPGVTVITSGQPGAVSQVRIRGFGSFTNNEPLYVVDGVPMFNIDFLNANDIETTTILKDAASASIYGARASAGVILITTKKGKSGKLSVTYDMSYGWAIPGKGLDLMTPQQQADMTWEALKAAGQALTHPQYGSGATPVLPDWLKVGADAGLSGLAPTDPRLNPALYNINFEKGPVYQMIRANKSGTDWYEGLTETGPIQNHSLGFSGANENAKYYVGLSYYDEHGTVLNTQLKKYGLRMNTEFKVKEGIRIGENFQYTYRERPGLSQGDQASSENEIMFALTINPLIPLYDEYGGFGGTTAKGFNNSTNPVAVRIRSKNSKGFASTFMGNIYAEVDFLKNFTFRTSFGGMVNQYQFRFINYRTYENSENVGNNTFGEGAGNSAGWVWTNQVRYAQDFGAHSINAVAGIESVADGYRRDMSGSGLNPFSLNNSYLTLTNTDPSGRALNSSGSPLIKLYSQFAKVDYSYDQTWLFSGTIRRDGASVFSKEDQYGVFPALSGGVRLTQLPFMRGVSQINELKIRGGWGKMGNSRISPNNLLNTGGSSATFGYDIAGGNTTIAPGIALTGIGNPFAKWETNITTNIGFDGTFFNNKFDVIFDWYKRKTEDLLFQQELAATLGIAAPPFVNIGSMENSGVDMMFTYKDRAGDFRYEADLIFTTYTNKITRVSDITDNFDVTWTNRIGGGIVRNAVGQPVSSFYGYQVAGLFQDAADVTKSPTQDGAAPGRFKYADINGDNKINTDDRTYIGNPNPDFTYGFNARLFYKNFDLEALFYGVQGGKALNFTKWFTDFYPSFAGIGKSSKVLGAWTPTNTSASIPRFENVSNFSTNAEMNSYYVEDASYLRLRSLKIGYNLPANILSKAHISKVRVFVQGTNLFTKTKYTGTDPEVSGVDTNFGVDVGNYPADRHFIFGFNIGL